MQWSYNQVIRPLQSNNRSWYLFFMIDDFVIFNCCSSSAPSWLEKEEQLSWLWKKWTPFCRIFMIKNKFFLFVLVKLFLRYINNFLKNMSWVALPIWIKIGNNDQNSISAEQCFNEVMFSLILNIKFVYMF